MAINTTGQPQYIIDLLDWGSGINMSWTGDEWNSGDSTTTITYTFNHSQIDSVPTYKLQALSSLDEFYVEQMMVRWENVADIDFVENNSSYDLNFAEYKSAYNPPNQLGVTYNTYLSSPFDLIIDSEVILNPNMSYSSSSGYGQYTVLHELGHALGLGHPADDPYHSDYNNDNTIMSYIEGPNTGGNTGNVPYTPMIYDIAAIQFLYGANYNYKNGNTTITLYNSIAETVWDGGGIDTITANINGGSATIDLREGFDGNDDQYFSQQDNNKTFLAFNANIENAIGSNQADTINGNNLSNNLSGKDGDDVIEAHGGDDTLIGGSGADNLDGGDGTDTADYSDSTLAVTINLISNNNSGGDAAGDILSGIENINGSNESDNITGDDYDNQIVGNLGDDTIFGGDGNDAIYGNGDNDTIFGNRGDDTIYGGNGNDIIYGNRNSDDLYGDDGNDMVDGGNGTDTVNGGNGDDILYGNGDNDTVYGGKDNDTIFGNKGNDFLYGNKGNDSINGNFGDDTIYGGHGDDTINGQSGQDDLYGGLGLDIFVFSNQYHSNTNMRDSIHDFLQTEDQIDLTAFSYSSISDFSITQSNGNTYVTDATSGFFSFEMTGLYSLSDSDFIFV